MSVQPIRLFGDPVLRTPAEPVVDFDKELRVLVKDLEDTMMGAPGVGLAAPQIGVGLRVFTYYVDDTLGHLVNPVLDLSDEEFEDEEGCLSFPGLSYPTIRSWGVSCRSSGGDAALCRSSVISWSDMSLRAHWMMPIPMNRNAPLMNRPSATVEAPRPRTVSPPSPMLSAK